MFRELCTTQAVAVLVPMLETSMVLGALVAAAQASHQEAKHLLE
jgi:hypothetical protein